MAVKRLKGVAILLAVAAAAVACGSGGGAGPASPTQPTPPQVLRSQITDPAGEVAATGVAYVLPDLIGGTFEVNGGMLSVAIDFAPQTLVAGTLTRVIIYLDTDQNPNTGLRINSGETTIGYEHTLTMDGGINDVLVHSSEQERGRVPLMASANRFEARVPMSMLGNDDGRLNYKVVVFGARPDGTIVVADTMPTFSEPAASIQ